MTDRGSLSEPMFLHLTPAVILLCGSVAFATASRNVFETVLGQRVYIDALLQHLPNIHYSHLGHHVFEMAENDLLVSRHSRLSIPSTAPHIEHVSTTPSIPAFVNGLQILDFNVQVTTLRKGNGYTFVYANKSSLLAAWGPSFELIPLIHSGVPNIFVNIHTSRVIDLSNDIVSQHHDTLTSEPQALKYWNSHLYNSFSWSRRKHRAVVSHEKSLNKEYNSKMQFSFNNDYFFNIAVAYDSTFCARYDNSPETAQQILETVVHETGLYLGYVVDTRLAAIVGFCDIENDPLAPPPSLTSCAQHPYCSTSTLLLDHFRNFWAIDAPDILHDAVYFFSGYGDGTPVAGAAYLRSVCSVPYNVGWVEIVSPVILAHEMGHTLGAPHDLTGLMKPQLYVNETDLHPSAISTLNMQEYLNTLSSKECVLSKLGETQSGAQTTYFVLNDESPRNPTDVAFAFHGKGHGSSTFVLDILKKESNNHLTYYRGKMISVTYDGMPRLRNRTKPRRIPTDLLRFSAGAGLAVVSLSSPNATDLIYFVENDGTGYYGVGFNINDSGIAAGGWQRKFKVPHKLGLNVTCLGMTAGRLRAGSFVDYVFAIVDGKELYYIVGFDANMVGYIQGGWTPKIPYPHEIGHHVGDVSVALFDIDEDGSQDLILMWTEENAGLWNTVASVGSSISDQGKVLGEWTSFVVERRAPVRGISKLTGGIAIAKLSPWEKPVTVLYDGRFSNGRSLNGMEVGFDVIRKPSPLSNPSTVIIEKTKCEKCYNEANQDSCRIQLDKCVEKMSDKNWRAIIGKGPFQPIARIKSFLAQPDSSTLECNGFYHLYIKESESNCQKPVEPDEEIAAGVAYSLLEGLRDAISLEANNTLSPENINLSSYKSLFRESDAGTSGHSRTPKPVVIVINSRQDLRRAIVIRALAFLKNKPDFSVYFQSNIPILKRTFHAKDGHQVVILEFRITFQPNVLF